jgi:hypothetical protein
LAVDFNWELTLLESVHEFYRALLCDFLFEEIIVPRGLEPESLSAAGRNSEELVGRMRRWLNLLDMAISPEMLRHALNSVGEQELAEALLRYYARKPHKSDYDRDKTDFVVTYYYRKPRVPGQWERRGLSMDGLEPAPPFKIALLEILDDGELPELTPEEGKRISEFQFLAEESEYVERFDDLLEAGLIRKAREIKQGLGEAFYHPSALAAIGPYNAAFSRRFTQLAEEAVRELRSFADEHQQQGGNPEEKLEGDITMQQISEVQAPALLNAEYLRAQERLRQVARMNRAVTKSRKAARATAARAAGVPQAEAEPSVAEVKNKPQRDLQEMLAAAAGNAQEPRIRTVEESIRTWVRTADERCRRMVPMKFGNFTLLDHEADAYRAAFAGENSFRGNNASILMRMVSIMARLQAELLELKERQSSQHLWRPHADALQQLQQSAAVVLREAELTQELATQRGLADKAKALSATMERLRARVADVKKSVELAGLNSEAPAYGSMATPK